MNTLCEEFNKFLYPSTNILTLGEAQGGETVTRPFAGYSWNSPGLLASTETRSWELSPALPGGRQGPHYLSVPPDLQVRDPRCLLPPPPGWFSTWP